MNILIMFNRPIIAHCGGVERVSTILAEQFRSMKHRVFFLCYSELDFNDGSDKFPDGQIFLSQSSEATAKKRFIEKLLTENKIDIIIDQVQLIELCKIIKDIPDAPPIISVFHSQPFSYYGKERMLIKNYYPTTIKGKLFKLANLVSPIITRRFYTKKHTALFKEVLGYADYLCLLSRRFIPRFVSIYPDVDEAKLIAVNNPNTFIPSPTIDFSSKEKIIVIVGRVYNLSKNMLDFLKVWQKVSKRNFQWRAIVVGDGPDLDRLKRYALSNRIERIEFAGNQTDVKSFYKRASISCVTSIHEGWTMVISEAMSQGCIPVAYDSFEAVRDLISDCEDGFIVPRFDTDAMTERLMMLIENPDMRASMAKNANRTIQRFNADNIASQWLELFAKIKK